jgi:hypothetical protein
MPYPVKILSKLSDKTGEKDQPLAGISRAIAGLRGVCGIDCGLERFFLTVTKD